MAVSPERSAGCLAKMRVVSQTGDLEDPATKAEAWPKGPNHQPAQPSMPDAAPPPKPGGRPWRRRVLFALLPLVLIGGGYWYVTGGQTVSMDDAYVESDKVGVSTEVAGM
jgi:membrane fusion protein (multidrug efflux system)